MALDSSLLSYALFQNSHISSHPPHPPFFLLQARLLLPLGPYTVYFFNLSALLSDLSLNITVYQRGLHTPSKNSTSNNLLLLIYFNFVPSSSL